MTVTSRQVFDSGKVAVSGQIITGVRLPYDAEVEWIGNTGAEIIDTQIVYSDFQVDITFQQDRSLANAFLWTGNNGTGNNAHNYPMVTMWSAGVSIGWDNQVYDNRGRNVAGTHTISYNVKSDGARTCVYDGTVILTKSTPPGTAYNSNVKLFWRNGVGPAAVMFRVCGFAMWSGNTVIFDAIPVRFTNESGVSEGALYDKISGQLFGNSGGGAFIIGPDKR